jgi:nucleotide-binding universal stress UspA family protein
LSEEEKARVEREEFEATDFVPAIERLLVAVDASANGRFTARLAGLLAGARQIMTTVLELDRNIPASAQAAKNLGSVTKTSAKSVRTDRAGKREAKAVAHAATKANRARGEAAAAEAQRIVETSAQTAHTEGESGAPIVETSLPEPEQSPAESVAARAKKGFDLLFLGLSEMLGAKGAIHGNVSHIASGFEHALALVCAKGEHLERPLEGSLHILIPVTGTSYSRRAAEVALTLAKGSGAPATAFYVSNIPSEQPWYRRLRMPLALTAHEEEILRDIRALAERIGVGLAISATAQSVADKAIIRRIKQGKHNLVVLGVSLRPGETLYFGNTATTVLRNAECSVMLVATR